MLHMYLLHYYIFMYVLHVGLYKEKVVMMCWSLAQFSVLYPSSFESKLRAGLLETFQEFLRELAMKPHTHLV